MPIALPRAFGNHGDIRTIRRPSMEDEGVLKKVKQCASTMNCRYKLALKVAVVLTIVVMGGVWLLADKTQGDDNMMQTTQE